MAQHWHPDFHRKDLEEAIQLYCEALQLCLPGNPGRHYILNNLAIDLEKRYDLNQELEDLEEAIRFQLESLEVTPPEHSSRGKRLNRLNRLLKRRERHGGNPSK